MTSLFRFLNIVLTGIIAGILLGIWMGYNPSTFAFETYREYQQNAIKRLNTIMPVLGLIGIVLTIISAVQQKSNKTVFKALITAAVLLIIAGVVTRFGNQPINKIVMTWSANDTPVNWTDLRAQWWALHKIRAVASILAFFIIAWAGIRKP